MSKAPNLLNDDGTASIATAAMMSHHAFRRDLGRFQKALATVAAGDSSRVEALREEWRSFHLALHGHHDSEDNGVFPSIAGQHESAKKMIEGLLAEHRRIAPLIEQGAVAFAALPETAAALGVVRELEELLRPHLATEEREIVPFLRASKAFPPPPNEEVAAMQAQGFAWAMQGIAPDIIERVSAMLPESVCTRLPAARAAFDARCERVWGRLQPGAARTPIPDPVRAIDAA
jgi:hemerythrin-like domain-containing protein